jgi:outer membrane protein OmpA-like peptidoglycan-associated protein
VAQITEKMNNGKGTVGALLNDRTMYTQATESVTAMHDDLEALKSNFLLRGFFNKRGYVDSDELKKHEISALPAGQPIKTFTFTAKELFGKDSGAKIKDKKVLQETGDYLQTKKFGLVVVAAAAGMKGDADKMLVLTQAQSTLVRNYLVQNFKVDDRRIKTMGLGKSDELGGEHTVEIRVYAAGK